MEFSIYGFVLRDSAPKAPYQRRGKAGRFAYGLIRKNVDKNKKSRHAKRLIVCLYGNSQPSDKIYRTNASCSYSSRGVLND